LSEVANVTDAALRMDIAARTVVIERGAVFVPLARTEVAIARMSVQFRLRSADDADSVFPIDGLFAEYLAMSVAI
jgi:hypothetical protein